MGKTSIAAAIAPAALDRPDSPTPLVPSGVNGLAFNLEENSVGIIILGDYLQINEGEEVESLLWP